MSLKELDDLLPQEDFDRKEAVLDFLQKGKTLFDKYYEYINNSDPKELPPAVVALFSKLFSELTKILQPSEIISIRQNFNQININVNRIKIEGAGGSLEKKADGTWEFILDDTTNTETKRNT
ncbi:MAG: hypothetical protein QXG39_06360 [Candidatus Aenigmatarchaeota archaeon]